MNTHSFNRYLLSPYNVTGTILGTKNTSVSKTD